MPPAASCRGDPGVLTGIGFLGAGVVLLDRSAGRIRGLTTAASVWVTAALGIACALASWVLIALGMSLALFLLVALHPLERWLERGAAAAAPRVGAAVHSGSAFG